MSRGVLLFAQNNEQIDYIKQAVYLAKRIKRFLDLPVSLVTDSKEYLENTFGLDDFDKIIPLLGVDTASPYQRTFFDGAISHRQASFKNTNRYQAFELSPYNQTLVLDTDYVINDKTLLSCFNSQHNLMMYKKSEDLANTRNIREFEYVSDTSIDFYWATCVYFTKCEKNKIFFDLVNHIADEWTHYRRVYQINSTLFRNDFAFAIAAHIMNGFKSGEVVKELPGTMIYTTDKDVLQKIDGDNFIFLVEKPKHLGEYYIINSKRRSVHVMNKFSLNRCIDEELSL